MTERTRRIDNSIMRLALSATEATIGQAGLNAVLHLAGLDHYFNHLPPNNNQLEVVGTELSALMYGIAKMYGEKSSRGIFRRWGLNFGRASVESRPAATVLKPMLGLLPVERRTSALLDALVREANSVRGENLHTLQEDAETFTVTFSDCLYCYGFRAHDPMCLTIVSTLETVLQWGTGRDFTVTETTCMACGDPACTFLIDKRPLNV
jgi:bacteriochlorophyll 4-vinyl reductase